MRKRLNKIVSTFVAGVLCMSFVPLTAIASDEDIALTSDAAIVETVEGEDPAASEPVETPEVHEVVEPTEPVDEPVVEEGVEPAASAVALFNDEIEVQADEGVASVNGAPYDSLQDAVNAASGGATILLNQDVTERITVSSAKSFALDLQGHTINANNAGVAMNITVDGCAVTIKNGSIINGKGASPSYGAGIVATKKNLAMTLENLKFVNNDSASGYAIAFGPTNAGDYGRLTMKGCSITGSAGGVYVATYQPVAIENLEIYRNSATGSAREQLIVKSKKGVTNTFTNVNIHDNDLTKNGSSKATVQVSAGIFEFTNCAITQNSAGSVGGLRRDAGSCVTLTNTVIAHNVSTATGKPTSSSPYTGGIAAIMSKSSSTPTPTLTIHGGAIYGNEKDGQPSDIFMSVMSNRYGFGYDVVDILAPSAMNDPQNGGNGVFQSYGYEWSIDEAATATYGFDMATLRNAIQPDGRIAFDTKTYPKVPSNTSPGATFVAQATTEPKPVASIDDSVFLSLSKAFEAAHDGDIIKLYFEEGADKATPIPVSEKNPIIVDKNVTFDVNGGYASGAVSFKVEEDAQFSLVNSGEGMSQNSGFTIENAGKLVLSSGIDVRSVANTNSGELKVDGIHNAIAVDVANGNSVKLADDVQVNDLSLTLAKKTLASLNDGTYQGDLKLVSGDSTDALQALLDASAIMVVGKANPLVQLFLEDKDIIVRLVPPTAVYIGGASANDENSGFASDQPVASLRKAIDLLKSNKDLEEQIIVVGEIAINEKTTWKRQEDDPAVCLVRYKEYEGALVRVYTDAALSLRDVTLDGGSFEMYNRDARQNMKEQKEGFEAKAPLVIVENGASLTVDDGAMLHSNNNSGSMRGGAIHNAGELIINGGVISDNKTVESGGAIYNLGGTVVMNDGQIDHNQSVRWDGAAKGRSKASGGGICIATGHLELNGGSITYNKTTGYLAYGGGIALGDCSDRSGSNLTMTMNGGAIKNNTAYGNGGGIAVWAGGSADIFAGSIEDNAANYQSNVIDARDSYWGGGGIYIEKNAEVRLKNVEIADNAAAMGGSAINCCPTTDDVKVYIKDGAVIHDNHGAADVSVFSYWDDRQFSHDIPMLVSKFTPNGVNHKWVKGDGALATTADLNRVLLKAKKETAHFYSQLSGEEASKAAESCSVFIKGNYSGKSHWDPNFPGGGIGCNGALVIGTPDTHFVLEKRVSEDSNEKVASDLLGTSIEDAEFEFEITFTDAEGDAYANKDIEYYKYGKAATFTTNEEGKVWVKLKKDEYILACGIPNGVSYEIVETTFASSMNVETSIVITDKDDPRYVETDVSKLLADLISGGEKDIEDKVIAYGLNEVIVVNEYTLSGFDVIKELKGGVYDSGNPKVGNSTAVFHIEGFANEDDARASESSDGASKFYDNYVSMNFTQAGAETVSLRNLPVGSWFKVTEVSFDGDGYHIDHESNAVKIFKLEKITNDDEGNELVVQVFKFTNISDEEETPNQGAINRYSFSQNGNSVNDLPFYYDQISQTA